MKILYFLEPMPLRDSYYEFKSIAEQFVQHINFQNNNISRSMFFLYAHPKLLQAVELDKSKKLYSSVSRKFDFITDWKKEGIFLWKDVLEGGGLLKGIYISLFEDLFSSVFFDGVVTWGNNKYLKNFCTNKKIPLFHLELGPLRENNFSNSFIIDFKGVNNESIFNSISEKDILKNNKENYHLDTIKYFTYDEIENISYKKEYSSYQKLNNFINFKNKKISLLTMQLYDDANLIVLYSNKEIDFFEIYKNIIDNLFIEKDTFLIIKPHPHSKYRKGSLEMNNLVFKYLKKKYDSKYLIVDENINGYDLLKHCDESHTVNSSFAIESILAKKPTKIYARTSFTVKDEIFLNEKNFNNNYINEKYDGFIKNFYLSNYVLSYTNFQNSFLFSKLILNHFSSYLNAESDDHILKYFFLINKNINFRKNYNKISPVIISKKNLDLKPTNRKDRYINFFSKIKKFDSKKYLDLNPDVNAHKFYKFFPLLHFIKHGRKEKR